MLYGKNENNEHANALEFTTKTTPTLIPYAKMSVEEVISKLEIEGLILLLLDDGWFSKPSEDQGSGKWRGRFSLTAYQYDPRIRSLILQRFNEKLEVDGREVGIKRVNIGFVSDDNLTFYNVMRKFMPTDIDVIKKKFGYIIETEINK